MQTPRTQQRQTPDTRRKSLIDATIACLKSGGLEAASVRKVSARAGVSVGLINHHFSNHEALIAAAYAEIAEALFAVSWDAAQAAGNNPRDQLRGFVRGALSLGTTDTESLKIWIAFWTMNERSALIKQVHDESNREHRKKIEHLLQRLQQERGVKAFDMRLAAIGLSAMLDGLWLEMCLDPHTFSVDEAVQMCDSWIEGICRGTFQVTSDA
ncbi:MAG: TetR/AcrR family transcriptional regulator [Pseudomonadota bacterium]